VFKILERKRERKQETEQSVEGLREPNGQPNGARIKDRELVGQCRGGQYRELTEYAITYTHQVSCSSTSTRPSRTLTFRILTLKIGCYTKHFSTSINQNRTYGSGIRMHVSQRLKIKARFYLKAAFHLKLKKLDTTAHLNPP
jgi:hypothetical protein